MASKKNPQNSTILQVLIDLEGAGFKAQVQPVIDSLKANKKLLGDLDTRFAQRAYNDRKLSYTQLTIDERLLQLSDPAFKVLVYLGMYCSQDGKVSIKAEALAKATHIGSSKTAQRAVKELMDKGLLVEVDGAKRHEPAIWQVHPSVLHSGKRTLLSAHEREFLSHVKPEADYLLGSSAEGLVTQRDCICRTLPDGTSVYYIKLDLVPAEKEKPSDDPQSTNGSKKNKISKSHDTQDQLAGQLTIFDVITEDDDLPF